MPARIWQVRVSWRGWVPRWDGTTTHAGWHATSTTAPVAAATVAATAMGLDVRRTAMAMALSVSSAGGVQRAFGSDAKAIQVGLAVDAGLRAAQLVADGATVDCACWTRG